MLVMVGILCLTVFAIQHAKKPSTWYWLTGRPDQTTTVGPSRDDIDYTVRKEVGDVDLKPGEFIAVASDPELPTIESPKTETSDAEYDVQVPKSDIGPVRDNTVNIRRSELKGYAKLLGKTNEVPLSYLERAARRDVAYTVLMIESEKYRGELITVEGEVAIVMESPSYLEGNVEKVYDIFIRNIDSGENYYWFKCTEIPEGLPNPADDDVRDPIRVRLTGYFFKRAGYASQGGLSIAPLLIAKRARWFRPVTMQQQNNKAIPYILGFVITLATFIGLMVFTMRRGERKFQRDHLKRLTEAPKEALTALDGVQVSTMSEFFDSLDESDSTTHKAASAQGTPEGGATE